jgi:hypothetical protein
MPYVLGKRDPYTPDHPLYCAPRLMTADVLDSLPPIPESMDWTKPVSRWGAMENDRIGDCGLAGPGHMIQAWTANASAEVVVPDSQIVLSYSAVSGYDPATGANDKGVVLTDVLQYWQSVGIGGHKIAGFLSIEPSNLDLVRAAIYLFGGVLAGVKLPAIAQQEINAGQPWSVIRPHSPASQPGTWGGHAIPLTSYDDDGMACVTWGKIQPMTWAWWDMYTDECYAVVSEDWLDANGRAPSGLNLTQLLADLKVI